MGATLTCKKGVIRDLWQPITMLGVGGRGYMATGPTQNATDKKSTDIKSVQHTWSLHITHKPWGFTALPIKYNYVVESCYNPHPTFIYEESNVLFNFCCYGDLKNRHNNS